MATSINLLLLLALIYGTFISVTTLAHQHIAMIFFFFLKREHIAMMNRKGEQIMPSQVATFDYSPRAKLKSDLDIAHEVMRLCQVFVPNGRWMAISWRLVTQTPIDLCSPTA